MVNVSRIYILLFSILCQVTWCQTKKYYKNYGGKILTESSYDSLKQAKLKIIREKLPEFNLVEDFRHPKLKNDSIIIDYNWIITKDVEDTKKRIAERNTLIGKEYPIYEALSFDGQKISIDDLKGKPTLINLWFTSCAPCIEEMPVLNRMKEKHGDKFNFIAITYEKKDIVDKFLKRKEFNFTHIVDSKELTTDLGFKGFPVNLFLDKSGILKRIEGNVPYKIDKDGKVVIGENGKFVSTEGELFIEILESYL